MMENDFIKSTIQRFKPETCPTDFVFKAEEWRRRWVSSGDRLFPDFYLIRDVILWDPLALFPSFVLQCPLCSSASQLSPSRWEDGSSASHKPRVLHGLRQDTVLVSRVYRCKQNDHQIKAHDAGVLDQTSLLLETPFVLLHKSGLTRELYDFIETHSNIGTTSVSDIVSLWHQSEYEFYIYKKSTYQKTVAAAPLSPADCCLRFPKHSPRGYQSGLKLIVACTIQNYASKEILYNLRMCQMTATMLSADHTFKVSANIGIVKDGQWLRIYDSLFLVMNEQGVVVSWRLSKGSKFASIEASLVQLKSRLDGQQATISMIVIDNCCKWSDLLAKIFPSASIKLDPFHAIQRITREIPKKKGTTENMRLVRREMLHSLSLMIRQPGDCGKERTQDTASPSVIESSAQSFLLQWKTVMVDGKRIFPDAAVKSLDKLMAHVKNGCLSYIPPSFGTSRNEGIHKQLNNTFRGKKFGLQRALASLGSFFYRWNERRLSAKPIRVIPAVETYVYHLQGEECTEFFGIGVKSDEIQSASDETVDKGLVTDEQESVRKINSSSSSESGEEFDSDEDPQGKTVPVEMIEETLIRADDYTRLSETILQLGDNLRFNVSHITLLKSALCLLSCDIGKKPSHKRDLENTLQVYKFVVVPENPEYCSFGVFSEEIKSYIDREILSNQEIQYLESLSLVQNGKFDFSSLPGLVISELYKNEAEYACFQLASKNTFKHEVSMLEAHGGHSSNILNCIPLAISNVLRIQIVVFTGMLNTPVIPLSPRRPALFRKPIYVGYDQRYIQVMQCPAPVESEEQLEEEHTMPFQPGTTLQPCRCGKGASKGKRSCTTTRCKCVSKGRSCKNCNCSNCENIFGKRELQEKTLPEKTISRKRRRHEISSQLKTNLAFLIESNEPLPLSKWSIYEQIVLVELSRTLFSHETFDINVLCSVLTNINKYSVPQTRTFMARNENEISKQVFNAIAIDNAYQKLIKEQLRMNSA